MMAHSFQLIERKNFYLKHFSLKPIFTPMEGAKKSIFEVKKGQKKVKNDKNVKILPVWAIRIHIVTTKIHLE